MPNNLTDAEIIKALECCSNYNDCDKCDFEPKDNKKKTIGCCLETMKNALDLITRQQAEIEKWQKEFKRACAERDARIVTTRFVKSEAVKEFAERLKEKKQEVFTSVNITELAVTEWTIDNLVKEMVGDK